MEDKEKKIVYLEDMDALEPLCIALRHRSAILFLYPYREKVAKQGAKIMTRDGRIVKRVHPAKDAEGNEVIVGELDGEGLVWDMAGRMAGAYHDDPRDLYIPERYFIRSWKDTIRMSNSEWALQFQRPHPTVEIPERW